MNIATNCIALAILITVYIMFRKKTMNKEVKYSRILKKFEKGTRHLMLNTTVQEEEDDENENKKLLEEEKEPSVIADFEKQEEVEDNGSMISHYMEDEDGTIRRIMIKKADAPGIVNDFEKSGTFKNGILGNMHKSDGYGMNSDGTVEGKPYPNNILKSQSYIDQDDDVLCEDPPEFIDSEEQDIIGRSIEGDKLNLKSLKQE